MVASIERLWVISDGLFEEDILPLQVLIGLRDPERNFDWRPLYPDEPIVLGDEWCAPGDPMHHDDVDFMTWTVVTEDDVGRPARSMSLGEGGPTIIVRRRTSPTGSPRMRVAAVLESFKGIRESVGSKDWPRLVDALASLTWNADDDEEDETDD